MPDAYGFLLPSEERERVKAWVSQRCELSGETRTAELWRDFDQWQTDKGVRAMIRMRFGDALTALGHEDCRKYRNYPSVRKLTLRT